jgi:hypothetical protein
VAAARGRVRPTRCTRSSSAPPLASARRTADPDDRRPPSSSVPARPTRAAETVPALPHSSTARSPWAPLLPSPACDRAELRHRAIARRETRYRQASLSPGYSRHAVGVKRVRVPGRLEESRSRQRGPARQLRTGARDGRDRAMRRARGLGASSRPPVARRPRARESHST